MILFAGASILSATHLWVRLKALPGKGKVTKVLSTHFVRHVDVGFGNEVDFDCDVRGYNACTLVWSVVKFVWRGEVKGHNDVS